MCGPRRNKRTRVYKKRNEDVGQPERQPLPPPAINLCFIINTEPTES